MYVKTGKYLQYWGPYQIADLLQKVGVSEDRCYSIGGWLADTWVDSFLQKVDNKRTRKEKVIIHNYDVWSADTTLALIILPTLKKLKEDKQGAPFVADEDVPDELKRSAAPPLENDYDTDDNWFLRYDYVLDQMIWSFEQIVNGDWEDNYHSGEIDIDWEPTDGEGPFELKFGPNDTHVFDREGYAAHAAKIQDGLNLFGRYYLTLWT